MYAKLHILTQADKYIQTQSDTYKPKHKQTQTHTSPIGSREGYLGLQRLF